MGRFCVLLMGLDYLEGRLEPQMALMERRCGFCFYDLLGYSKPICAVKDLRLIGAICGLSDSSRKAELTERKLYRKTNSRTLLVWKWQLIERLLAITPFPSPITNQMGEGLQS